MLRLIGSMIADCRLNRASARPLNRQLEIGNRESAMPLVSGDGGPPVGLPDRPGARDFATGTWRMVHAPPVPEPVLEEVAV
jgi:hypothetical protein